MEQTELKERRYVGVRETLIYGVANGGQVIGYNLVRMQLTFFLVTVFGIPGQAVSLMIFFMGIWDTMNDPIMGTIVDKTRTRYGKLRPYLLFVPIPLGVATILFFGGAEFLRGVESTTAKIVYMCITYFIWEFFYTIGDIPFWGMSAAISPNPKDRSRVITSARLISGAIGGLVGPVISIFIDLQKSGKPVPSLLFQHIVVPEVYNMFTEVSKGTKGAVRGNANHTKQYYVTNPDYIDAGHLNEGPCPANTANDGQLDSWVKQGDILGAIFGHDHVNDYAGTYKGIRLLAAPAVTFYSYGNYRGVRTIDLDESNLTTFQTQVIPADKLMDYTVKNPYIREHGYYEYKSVFIPALCGGIAGLAALTAVIIVLVKVIKKHKAKK